MRFIQLRRNLFNKEKKILFANQLIFLLCRSQNHNWSIIQSSRDNCFWFEAGKKKDGQISDIHLVATKEDVYIHE